MRTSRPSAAEGASSAAPSVLEVGMDHDRTRARCDASRAYSARLEWDGPSRGSTTTTTPRRGVPRKALRAPRGPARPHREALGSDPLEALVRPHEPAQLEATTIFSVTHRLAGVLMASGRKPVGLTTADIAGRFHSCLSRATCVVWDRPIAADTLRASSLVTAGAVRAESGAHAIAGLAIRPRRIRRAIGARSAGPSGPSPRLARGALRPRWRCVAV